MNGDKISYSVILTDIEGTTTSVRFVYEELFPYARKKIQELAQSQKPLSGELAGAFSAVKASHLAPEASNGDVANLLLNWMNEDKKETHLKSIQGLLWEDGYLSGAIRGHVYQDAADKIAAWSKEDKRVYIYSSGSSKAQQLLFNYSTAGDLSVHLKNYFDTRVGAKQDVKSYQKILENMEVTKHPEQVLFLSDVVGELDAAKAAGMQTILVVREGEFPKQSRHRMIRSFEEIDAVVVPKLRIFAKDGSLEKSVLDNASIAKELKSVGVHFEQWQTREIAATDTDETILKKYEPEIRKLCDQAGYQSFDLVHLRETHPERAAFRAKFLTEHTHSEDEVRFFVSGQGLFSLHIGDKVYSVLCQKGDLISVPAGIEHWFDMGDRPNFSCIRLFNNKDGWIAKYTLSTFEKSFPKLEDNSAILNSSN